MLDKFGLGLLATRGQPADADDANDALACNFIESPKDPDWAAVCTAERSLTEGLSYGRGSSVDQALALHGPCHMLIARQDPLCLRWPVKRFASENAACGPH